MSMPGVFGLEFLGQPNPSTKITWNATRWLHLSLHPPELEASRTG
jgi:hypothetical protein